ncbi:MAG: family 10 glycosylhydrolase [Myxococcota bacterium]
MRRIGLSIALLAPLACGDEPEPIDPMPATAGTTAGIETKGDRGEGIAALPIAPAIQADPGQPERLGLWVLCEGSQRVLESPQRMEAMLVAASRIGATDLFVQVYRGGRAWFDSSRADAGPYRALIAAAGVDPLAQLLVRAHEEGMRVHAWVNVLSLASNKKAPILDVLGSAAVLVDQHGRSILDYPKLDVPQPDRRYYRMGTPAVWLDAGAPGVADYLAGTYAELIERYPDLDGLHLDYIRYPGVLPFSPGSRFGVGLDFGYGDATRERFREQTGLAAPFGASLSNANRWDRWRREQVTELVRAVRTATKGVNPDIQLSAAVGAYADRVYLAEGQDWLGWLEGGLVEFAVPMAYTLDDRMFRYLAQRYSNGPHAERIWLGLGSWLFAKRPAGALGQLRVAREAGSTAQVLFSYDSIADSPALLEALVAGLPGEP